MSCYRFGALGKKDAPMVVSRDVRTRVEHAVGRISSLSPIEKGFSHEKKFLVTAEQGFFVLRSAPFDAFARKKDEYDLMARVHGLGVKCNRPVDFFESPDKAAVYSLYSYLPGEDAESCVSQLSRDRQYQSGFMAGADLQRIHGVTSDTVTWSIRKKRKHERYVGLYRESGYRFLEDRRVQRFIEMNDVLTGSTSDVLQHDDFHLGNIIIHNGGYGGVLDFNRYDWGDPLHEFVKLEWFTWPVSQDFARGQVDGYCDGRRLNHDDCRRVSVYVAMSIFSTVVWTLKYYPETMVEIEKKIGAILRHYQFFEKTVPDWAT